MSVYTHTPHIHMGYLHAGIFVFAYIHMHAFLHVHTTTYTYKFISKSFYVYRHMHTYICIYIHTCSMNMSCTYTYTCICMRVYIHIHIFWRHTCMSCFLGQFRGLQFSSLRISKVRLRYFLSPNGDSSLGLALVTFGLGV